MVHVGRENARDFNIGYLLQKGAFFERPDTVTVSGFIAQLLGIAPEKVTDTVKTVLLDNKVVDDPNRRIMDGTTLVLSGAMPGLVGAMLRSGSPYEAMRSTITDSCDNRTRTRKTDMVRIKFLNTVLRDNKERIVHHGFWIEENEDG